MKRTHDTANTEALCDGSGLCWVQKDDDSYLKSKLPCTHDCLLVSCPVCEKHLPYRLFKDNMDACEPCKKVLSEKDQDKFSPYKTQLNNEQFAAFRQCFESSRNLFITGQAGSGKSRLIQCIRNYAESSGRLLFTTAMTGCAAVSIDGMTLHYYMGIGLGEVPVKECQKKMSRDSKLRLQDTVSVRLILSGQLHSKLRREALLNEKGFHEWLKLKLKA